MIVYQETTTDPIVLPDDWMERLPDQPQITG